MGNQKKKTKAQELVEDNKRLRDENNKLREKNENLFELNIINDNWLIGLVIVALIILISFFVFIGLYTGTNKVLQTVGDMVCENEVNYDPATERVMYDSYDNETNMIMCERETITDYESKPYDGGFVGVRDAE